MAINHLQLVSALVDGQLTAKELDQALMLINSDDEARQAFIRYQQTSDILHGYTRNLHQDSTSLLTGVSAALRDEPTYSKAATSKAKSKILAFPQTIWKQATGLAIAASVGALTVIAVVQQQAEVAAIPVASAVPAETATLVSQGTRWTVGEPEVEDRLNNYLVDHNEYAGTADVFSYGRVVSYGSER